MPSEAPQPDAAPKPSLGRTGVSEAAIVTLGLTCAGTLLLVVVLHGHFMVSLALSLCLSLGLMIPLARRGPAAVRGAFEAFVLGPLMVWGLALNHAAHASCSMSECEDNVFRPLAEPQVYSLFGLYALTVLAYAVSRARPEALRPRVEALVHAGMILGLTLQLAVSIQFVKLLPTALILPVTMPVLAPFLGAWLFAHELRTRLVRRGSERTTVTSVTDASAYRAGGAVEVRGKGGAHRPTLARALALTPALAGFYVVLQAAWLHRPGAAFEVFTATCGYTLSRAPSHIIPSQHCHYLCTVAAQGHPWLVRPERFGRRNGAVILVNRQLAIANAFEDLLHERWPRSGAFARRTYDALGLPVSRFIRWKLLADAVYLAMKPAEWIFYATLLLLDRSPPESRIERMYRG